MLDAAGFTETSIVLSNNLDELVIWQIITQIQEEAPRYGVEPDHLIRRLVNPYAYHVSLTQRLWDLKQQLVRTARSGR